VQGGEGTAASAIKGIFGIYNTQEVLDLIEWMRAYNLKPGRSKLLSFTAFDMQGPEAAAKCAIDAVGRLGREEGESMRRAYDGIDGMHGAALYVHRSGQLSDAEKAAFGAKAAAGLKLLEEHRDALLTRLTPAEYQRAHRCATIVVQAYIRAAKDIYTARDAAMAENVRWLAEVAHPGERIALWAHNSHVGASPYLWGVVSMGMHLRKHFGQQMRVLGFALDRGEVRAVQTKQGKTVSKGRIAVPLLPAKGDTPEALLKAAGVPRAILDLRTLPQTGALGAWLAEPQPIRTIGADFDPDATFTHYYSSVLQQTFDALIFFEETTAARPLQ
jgi:erythromycin esterase